MKRRWIIYLAIGFVFGVFDFFYLGKLYQLLAALDLSSLLGLLAWFVLNPGIWLLPAIPIAWVEAGVSRSRWWAAAASMVAWCAGIVSYYLANCAQLAFLGVPGREEMHISSHGSPYFWPNWSSVLRYDIMGGMWEWMLVAVVGGALVGLLVGSIRLALQLCQPATTSRQEDMGA